MTWVEQVERVAGAIPAVVDWVAIVIFLTGFAKAIASWLRCELIGDPAVQLRHTREIRLALGGYILLGLEVMIISDVVHSCMHPDLMSLAGLAGLVLVRTFIGFFLGKELESLHQGEA